MAKSDISPPVAVTGKRLGADREALFLAGAALAVFVVYAFRISHYSGIDAEQVRNGQLTLGFLDGFTASPLYYLYGRSHGPLFYGLALTPVYDLFGSSYLWIKLLGFLFFAGGVAVWALLLRRCWGFAPALLFLLWLALPPPFFEEVSHVTCGNHMESVFFAGVSLYFFLSLDMYGTSFAKWARFGLWVGFATFFCMQIAAVAAALAAAMVWRWRKAGLQKLLWPVAPAFLLAFSPHWIFRVYWPLSTDYIAFSTDALARWRNLFFDLLPLLPGYGRRVGPALSAALMIAAAAGLALALRDTGKTAAERGALPKQVWLVRVLALYLLAYFAAVGFSTMPFGAITHFYDLRYLLPPFPVFVAFACYLVSRLPKAAAAAILMAFAAAGGAALALDLPHDLAHWRAGWQELRQTRGDDYENFINLNLPPSWNGNLDKALKSVARLPGGWQEEGYACAGRELGGAALDRLRDGAPGLAPAARTALFRGLGMAAAHWIGSDSPELAQLNGPGLTVLENATDAEADAFAQGFGYQNIFEWSPRGFLTTIDKVETLDADGQLAAWYAAYPPAAPRRLACAGVIQRLGRRDPAKNLAAFMQGVGRWCGFYFRADQTKHVQLYPKIWGKYLEIAPTDEATAAMERGLAEGQALYLLSFRNRFADAPPLRNLALTRAELARRGVTLRQVATHPDEYVLVKEKNYYARTLPPGADAAAGPASGK
jgi:hypothetical protein